MRLLPVMNNFTNIANINSSAQYKNKNNNAMPKYHSHQYTGNASVDLAYVSMFDNKIAKDLKMMGLI